MTAKGRARSSFTFSMRMLIFSEGDWTDPKSILSSRPSGSDFFPDFINALSIFGPRDLGCRGLTRRSMAPCLAALIRNSRVGVPEIIMTATPALDNDRHSLNGSKVLSSEARKRISGTPCLRISFT